jgi:hypothetical protein
MSVWPSAETGPETRANSRDKVNSKTRHFKGVFMVVLSPNKVNLIKFN